MVGLPDDEQIFDMFSSVDRIPACDGRTDILSLYYFYLLYF